MFERILFLGYVFFLAVQGGLRGLPPLHPSVPHPSVPHPMTTVIPKLPIRQEATLEYFRHLDQLDNNLVYRPLASDFTTDLY
uniref:Uncharacterized protein n=1 Tax=viral metagenome TaxID=1070528 RepID=A0A6C0K3D4_9ZZZZ